MNENHVLSDLKEVDVSIERKLNQVLEKDRIEIGKIYDGAIIDVYMNFQFVMKGFGCSDEES
jgi:hypothetical protein